MALIEIKEITKDFGSLRALDRVELSIERGEVVGIVGPNGSGKTTLLNVISGYYRPCSGQILFEGRKASGK